MSDAVEFEPRQFISRYEGRNSCRLLPFQFIQRLPVSKPGDSREKEIWLSFLPVGTGFLSWEPRLWLAYHLGSGTVLWQDSGVCSATAFKEVLAGNGNKHCYLLMISQHAYALAFTMVIPFFRWTTQNSKTKLRGRERRVETFLIWALLVLKASVPKTFLWELYKTRTTTKKGRKKRKRKKGEIKEVGKFYVQKSLGDIWVTKIMCIS